MRIVLLRGEESFWSMVEVYLRSIHVEPSVVDRPEDVLNPSGRGPDLLIIGGSHVGHPSLLGLRAKVIVIDDSGKLDLPRTDDGRHSPTLLRWPCSKRDFLETTAGLLDLEPRKSFRALVRIGLIQEEHRALAESRDFSLSGMSFTSSGYFTEGSRIVVSLSLPEEDRSLVLHGRVVRSFQDESDGSSVYGVEFLDLDPERQGLLKRFVLS